MKRLMLSSMVALCACASSAGALERSSAPDSIVGPWRGVLMKGDLLSVADFRFASGEGGYRGIYWNRALMPIGLTNLQVGDSIHFEIPRMAVFDGKLGAETIEGTFRDETGEGTFKLEKQLDWDDPRNSP